MNNVVDNTLQEIQQVKKVKQFWISKYMKCEKFLNKISSIRVDKMAHQLKMLSTKLKT